MAPLEYDTGMQKVTAMKSCDVACNTMLMPMATHHNVAATCDTVATVDSIYIGVVFIPYTHTLSSDIYIILEFQIRAALAIE